jgi:hypothetical protein
MNIKINKSVFGYNMTIKLETAKEAHLFSEMFIQSEELDQSPFDALIWNANIRCDKPMYHISTNDNVYAFIHFPTLHWIESSFNTNQKDALKVKRFIIKSLK